MRRCLEAFLLIILFSATGSAARAGSGKPHLEGRIVETILLESDGPLTRIGAEECRRLIVLREGSPYKSSLVRRSLEKLYRSDVFHDVQVRSEEVGASGVRVAFVLIRKFLVSKVKIDGQFRDQLAIAPGSVFSHDLLEEAVQRQRQLYRNHGYYKAVITPELSLDHENAAVTVAVRIEPGEKARVAELTIEADPAVDGEALTMGMKTKAGGEFSLHELDEDIREIRRRLALDGFLRSSIALPEGDRYHPESNTVRLALRITPRERSLFRIEGSLLEESELMGLSLFTNRSVARIFALETVKELERLHQEKGYLKAGVVLRTDTTPDGGQALVFQVEAGPKTKLAGIRFEGNDSISDRDLERVLQARTPGLFQKGRFSTAIAERDRESIALAYASRGFLDAGVDHVLRDGRDRDDEPTLVFTIDEGQRYAVVGIDISGQSAVPVSKLLASIASLVDEPYSPLIAAQDRNALLAVYENLGYRDVDCRVEVSFPNPRQVHLRFRIVEGEPSFVDQVVVTGDLRTKEQVIRRQILVQPGQPLSLQRLLESETRLYDLSVFSSVQVREEPAPDDPTKRTVVFRLEESPRYTLVYGGGYSSFEGLRGTFGISNANFRGSAEVLALGLRGSGSRQRGELSWRVPSVLGRNQPTLFSLTAFNRNIRTSGAAIDGIPFDELRWTASARTERPLSRRESLFFGLRLEKVRTEFPADLNAIPEFFRQEERLRLGTATVSYINESRDAPANPKQGFLLSGEAALSIRVLGSEAEFFKLLAQGQYYYSLSGKILLASNLRVGWIKAFGRTSPIGDENPIPISERFFSGGSTTLRGLPQDLAGPLLTDPDSGDFVLVNNNGELDPGGRPVPEGGNALIVANLELRRPLNRFLSGTFFYDFGNVFASFSDLSRSGFSQTVGLGLRFETPVGPFRFDAGYNPNPPDAPGFRRWIFHLSLGHAF